MIHDHNDNHACYEQCRATVTEVLTKDWQFLDDGNFSSESHNTRFHRLTDSDEILILLIIHDFDKTLIDIESVCYPE